MGRFTAQPQEEAVEHAVAAAARFSTSGPHLLYADRSPVRGPKRYTTGSLEAVTGPLPCSETWFSTRRATSMARRLRSCLRADAYARGVDGNRTAQLQSRWKRRLLPKQRRHLRQLRQSLRHY